MQSYREYFEAEMRSLQELAQEFAEAYPEQASMLNLESIKDRDPYVERLLEGMAFLTSQIRLRLDDAVPQISGALLEQLMPALIRPYPSSTVLEFSGRSVLKEAVQLSKGQQVRAVNCGPMNANCEFTTTQAVQVQPLSISHLSGRESLGGGAQIDIHLRKQPKSDWQEMDLSALKLYAFADWQLAYTLIHALTASDTRVTASVPGRPVMAVQDRLRFKLAHTAAEDSLLPYAGRARSAFSVIHDYFCAREKYLFVELLGLQQLDLPETADELVIHIETPISLPVDTRLDIGHLKLNCVPAINLYEHDAEPILFDHKRTDYRVKPDRQIADYTSVYSVESVTGRDQSTGHTHDYYPLYAMRNRQDDDRVYSTESRIAGLDNRLTYLSLTSAPPFHQEVLSVETRVCNDQYPRRYIDFGGLNTLQGADARLLTVANITRPSRLMHAPDIQDYQWQLISLLSVTLSSISSVEQVQQLLSLFDWSGQPENQKRISAISGITTHATHRLKQGVLFQGLEVRVELAESGFSNRSDMYLFGAMLHYFFSGFANMTEFVQTKIIQLPTYKEWIWNPVFGSKALF
ncbi:type VI secretion system baseplate subunit TssF [Reinekea blandensis]|uniref:Type VI secretion system protein ImpG n=1 Tax=Reinekea blandensis MED297 TaxID=314283 RepID=A4BEV4_9GAMM|nr:type VI secretion system baseplate subunit TssF [Reinekea blandensis]EAR09289.1 hypothetical protein MED297_18413 [Reinekea sp. MED297] [Reinekea blandensis MED297]